MQLPADSIPIIEGVSIYKVSKSLSHISLKITGHGNHDLHKGAELWFSDWLAPITAVLLISDGENITLKISRAARAGSPGDFEHKIAAKPKFGNKRHCHPEKNTQNSLSAGQALRHFSVSLHFGRQAGEE